MYINKNKNKNGMSELRLSTKVKNELQDLFNYYHQPYESDSDAEDKHKNVVRTNESNFYPNSDTEIILEADYKGGIEHLKVEYDNISKMFKVEGFDDIKILNFATPSIQIVKKKIDKFFRKREFNPQYHTHPH